MTEECSKYGAVVAIEIPHVGGPAAGVGFVFVKYGSIVDAEKVKFFTDTSTLVYQNFHYICPRYVDSRVIRT